MPERYYGVGVDCPPHRPMVLLDLFCGAGGASEGYRRAGFEVCGVDINPMPHYPFPFRQADALAVLDEWLKVKALGIQLPFHVVHASPPCQAWTAAQRIRQREHPDLIGPTRERLEKLGLPYVIENVVGAPLRNPFMLCGAMFPELRVYRHRLFEANFPVIVPDHPKHVRPITKMGRPLKEGEFMHVVGNFSGVQNARDAMGIQWMTRNELREAIPPAYTEFLGLQIMEYCSASPGGNCRQPFDKTETRV